MLSINRKTTSSSSIGLLRQIQKSFGAAYDVDTDPCVIEQFGRDLLSLPPDIYQNNLLRAASYWRATGFPYPQISRLELERDFNALLRSNAGTLIRDGSVRESGGFIVDDFASFRFLTNRQE